MVSAMVSSLSSFSIFSGVTLRSSFDGFLVDLGVANISHRLNISS